MPLGQYSLSLIQTLQPAFQPIAQTLLDQCEAAGIPCNVVQGTRTFAQQQAVYDQGRSTPGAIVTKARPGDSYHQYGLALDIVPQAYESLPEWNPDGPYWAQIGAIGKSLGLTWGGDWHTPDRPHFELEAAPLSELKDYWNKFQSIMPIEVTPTTGGAAIILMIAAIWFLFVRPRLHGSGML